jgi:hypothetical protein
MVCNSAHKVNCAAVTVSIRSSETSELILILDGERRVLPVRKHPELFAQLVTLVVEAAESVE